MPEGMECTAGSKLGPGRLVLVVGPSGAGKDTLLDALRARLRDRKDVHFARRAITRASDKAAEDHDTISRDAFDAMVSAGDVALAWSAHDLGYIIPASCDEIIHDGGMVIANGSRRAVPDALAKYENVSVLLITAPVEVLAERLASRGRETQAEIKKRLQQADLEVSGVDGVVRIENTGTIEDSVLLILSQLGLQP